MVLALLVAVLVACGGPCPHPRYCRDQAIVCTDQPREEVMERACRHSQAQCEHCPWEGE